jgi:hypothetical protein
MSDYHSLTSKQQEEIDKAKEEYIQLLQRIMDEQGYIIICRNKEEGLPRINEIIIDDWGDSMNILNGRAGSALRIIGTATADEFMNQFQKYFPHRDPSSQRPQKMYFVKVSGE